MRVGEMRVGEMRIGEMRCRQEEPTVPLVPDLVVWRSLRCGGFEEKPVNMGVYDHLIYSKRFADLHRSFIKLHFDHTHEITMQITDPHVTITSHIINNKL